MASNDVPLGDVIELRSQSLSRVFEEIIAERKTTAGVPVSPETALESGAVLACVRVLSESLASLPLNYCRRLAGGGNEIADDKHPHEVLHFQPNSWMTSFEFRELMQDRRVREDRGAGRVDAHRQVVGDQRVDALGDRTGRNNCHA